MELICPQCRARNRFDAERAARRSRFICASCQHVFEATTADDAPRVTSPLGERAAEPFAPVAAAPAGLEDVLDIFDAPPGSFEDELDAAEPQSQVLEDLYVSPPHAAGMLDVQGEAPAEMSGAFGESATVKAPAPPQEAAAAPDFDAHAAAAEERDPLHITGPAGNLSEAVTVAAGPAEPDFSAAPESPSAAAPSKASAPARVQPPAPAYDKYAVGMRVLRISPTWLVLSSVGFFAVLLTLSWMSKPVGPVAEAVAAGAKLPNAATSPAAKAVAPEPVALVEAAKSAAEKALPPAAREAARPAAEPAKPPAAESQPEAFGPGSGDGKFTLQVGSFNNPSEANERVSQLRGAGYAARAVAVELPGRGTWYRVQAGRFGSREEAAKAGAQMRAKGAASAVMVTEIAGKQ